MKQLIQGTKLLQEGDYEKAEQHLQQALEADAFCGIAHNNLGKVYYHQGRLYEAAWQFQYAIKLLPTHPEPRNNLGLVLETTGKLDDAITQYKSAAQLAADDPRLLGNLARAHVRRGDRDDETRRLLRELIQKETRSDWRAWAERQLAFWPEQASKVPATSPD